MIKPKEDNVTFKCCRPTSRIRVTRQPCAGDHRAWVAQNEIDKVAAGAPQFMWGLCTTVIHRTCGIPMVIYIIWNIYIYACIYYIIYIYIWDIYNIYIWDIYIYIWDIYNIYIWDIYIIYIIYNIYIFIYIYIYYRGKQHNEPYDSTKWGVNLFFFKWVYGSCFYGANHQIICV